MKRLNVKFLVILLLSSAFLVVGTYFLWKFQMKRNSTKALERAEAMYEEGDLATAVDSLGRYLNLNPGDSERLAMFAIWRRQWYDDGGKVQPGEIFDSFKRAVEADRDEVNLELRRESAEFTQEIAGRGGGARMWQDAITDWQVVIREMGEENSVEEQVNLAECYFNSAQQKRDEKTLEILLPIVGYNRSDRTFNEQQATDPTAVEAYVLAARVYREHLLDEPTANEFMEQMMRVSENRSSSEANLAYARYLWQSNNDRVDEADEYAQNALALDPDNEEVILMAAQLAYVKGQSTQDPDQRGELLTEAQDLLERGVDLYPRNTQFVRLLSQILSMKGLHEAGRELIVESLKVQPDDVGLLQMKIELELQLGDVKGARDTLDEMKRQDIPTEYRHYYDALISLIEGKFARARRLLELVRPQLTQRDAQQAYKIYGRLYQCYELLGMTDLQLDCIRRMRAMNDSSELRSFEAQVLFELGKYEQAEALLTSLLEAEDFSTSPNQAEIITLLIRLKTHRQTRLPKEDRNWDEVDRLLVLVAPPDNFENPGMLAFRVQHMFTRGEAEQARSLLQQAREKYPEDSQLWLLHINALLDGHESEESGGMSGAEAAMAELEKFAEVHGDTPTTRGTKGMLMIAMGGDDIQEKLLALEEGVEGWSENDRLLLWRQLAAANQNIFNTSHALELLGRVAAAHPEDLTIRLQMFQMAYGAGDDAGMVDGLERIKELMTDDDATWKWAEGLHQLWLYRNDLGGPDALALAGKLADEARSDRPRWAAPYRLQAEVAILEGQQEAAIAALEQTLQEGPMDMQVLQLLVQLLIDHQRISEARRWMSSVEESQLTEAMRRQELVLEAQEIADVLQASDPRMQALRARVDSAVPADSENANDLLYRAQMMIATQSYDEAEAALRRSVEVAPGNTRGWLQLVTFLMLNNRRDEAVQVIDQARMQLPENEVPAALGQMYAMVGDYMLAEMYYKMGVNASPESTSAKRVLAQFYISTNRVDQAREYLNDILEGEEPNAEVIPADVAWARREAAKIFAQTGNYQDYLMAESLILANQPKGQPLPDEDLLLLGILAVGRPESLSRQHVIDRLEQRKQDTELLPDNMTLLLARLYHSVGRTADSRNLVLGLIGRHPDNQNIITFYINILIDEEAYAEVPNWLKQLDPKSYDFIKIQSTLWAEQGRVGDAVQLIQNNLLLPDKSIQDYAPEDYPRLRLAAGLIDELSEYDESLNATAEQLLRLYVEKQPGHRLLLIEFLGRQDDPDKVAEAFRMLEETKDAHEGVSLARIVQMGVAILRNQQENLPADSPYYALVNEWFEEGDELFGDQKDLLMQRANFEELQRNFVGALEYYERCLALPNLDFQQKAVVQNNMAYVLALQGDCNRALEYSNEAIENLGPASTLLDTRAVAYLTCGQPEKALAEMKKAMLGGENGIYLFHEARAYADLKQDRQAEASLRKALEEGLDPIDLLGEEQDILADMLQKYDIEDGSGSR